MGLAAIVTAGDRGAAKAIYGKSTVYLEIDGVPMVARVVEMLQDVPEIDQVWVVGDSERLESVFTPAVVAELSKPIHVVEQFRNLFENFESTAGARSQSMPRPSARSCSPTC